MKLEQILKSGKKAIATGLTLIAIGLTTPYCGGGSGGNPTPTPTPVSYQCNNSIDDDGDTLVDMADLGCSSPTDNSEFNTIANQPPIINSKVQPTSPTQTGNNIIYQASVTDADDINISVSLELSTDGINYTFSYPMDFISSNNYEFTTTSTTSLPPFNDGAIISARIKAKDSQNPEVFSYYPISLYNVLSEADGQNTIKTTLEDLISGALVITPALKTKPLNPSTDIIYDKNDIVLGGYTLHSDVLAKYNSPIGTCTSGTELHIDFVNLNGTEELVSPVLRYAVFDLSSCKLNNTFFYDGSFVYFDGSVYKLDSTDSTPKTKQQLIDGVVALVKTADADWNYKPIAEAGSDDQTTPVGVPIILDGTNSLDSDGTYTCEWDIDGNGIYDTTDCTTGAVYSTNGCYNATLRITDDEGAKSTDTTKIIVGSGC